jgi:hypothetical protein
MTAGPDSNSVVRMGFLYWQGGNGQGGNGQGGYNGPTTVPETSTILIIGPELLAIAVLFFWLNHRHKEYPPHGSRSHFSE